LGIGQAGDEIGCPGAGGCQANAHFAGGTGISLCGMNGTLFVSCKHMVDLIAMIKKGIVHRHNGSAGIPEGMIDTFFNHNINDGFGTGFGNRCL